VNAFRGVGRLSPLFARKNITCFRHWRAAATRHPLVDGFALAGHELAMGAHYRIVTENARMGQPELSSVSSRGTEASAPAPLIGPRRAAQMCINGEPSMVLKPVHIGLADEFAPSATALTRLCGRARVHREAAAGSRGTGCHRGKTMGELQELFVQPPARD